MFLDILLDSVPPAIVSLLRWRAALVWFESNFLRFETLRPVPGVVGRETG